MRFSLVGSLLVLIANAANAAITFQGTASTGVDTASRGTYQAWDITPGGVGAANGDLCILDATLDSKTGSASWPTISGTGGQTWATLFQSQTSTYARSRYWATFNGTWTGGKITITSSDVPNGAFSITGSLTCFHPTAGYTWSVDVSTSQAEYSAPGGSCDVTITGQTPTASASVVTVAAWMGHGDDVWALQTAGWTNPNSVTQIRNSYGGANSSLSQAYKIQSSASATGNVTNRQSTGGCSAGWTAITTFKETSGGGGGSSFVNRFMGFFRGAFAYNLGTGGGSPPGPGSMKWNPGAYGDCNQDGAAPFVALNNVNYNAIKSCIDYYSSVGGMTGVFIKASWTSFEGDLPGSYDGSVGNSMGAAGTIGHPLWDSLLAYAASAGMKVHIGIEWFSQGTPSCTFPYPKYLVQPACFGGAGTDSAGIYGVTVTPDGLVWIRIWDVDVMDRFIAMVSDFGARYDSNTTLDAISILWDDSSFTGGNPGPDSFTFTTLVTQLVRFATNVRPSLLHTGIYAMVNFMPAGDTATLFAGMANSANHMFYMEQDAEVWLSSDGDRAYAGASTHGSHDYRSEIPMGLRLSQTTQCTNHDSYAAQNGLSASQNTTAAQYYGYYFTSGKTDMVGTPLGPSYIIVGRIIGDTCPGVDHQQFAGTNGVLEYLQAHPLNTTRPSLYP